MRVTRETRMRPRVAPTPESDRYDALDLLRGFAVLGILVMNIQSFSQPFAGYFNPMAFGTPSTADFAVWSASHLFFDQKFMSIFSLLFGAGVLLMTTRVAERGGRSALLHYRRMFWLLIFGLIHAYILWYGDILVLYAVCGLFIYPARKLRPAMLAAMGIGFLAIGSLLAVFGGLSMPSWPHEEVRALADAMWQPPPERLAREIAAFQGGWLAQQPFRAEYAIDFHTFEIWVWGIWRAGGLMFLGMALFKWRVLTGERAPAFYTRLALTGFAIGLPLVITGIILNQRGGWNMRDGFFIVAQWNHWGSVMVALGWIGLVIRLFTSDALPALTRRLRAAGRMAFSCYIATTLICTAVFYGHGLGLFGTVARPGQVLVTVAVWIVLVALAPVWLARYQYGPLEWAWRSLTYWRREPMARRVAAPAAQV